MISDDAFRRYLLRHTKKGDRFRIFLSAIIKWIKKGFDYNFEEEIEELNNMKPYSIDLEIIPYPRLLDILTRT